MLKPFGHFTWDCWITGLSQCLSTGDLVVAATWRLRFDGKTYELKINGKDWRRMAAHGLRMFRRHGLLHHPMTEITFS